TAVFGAGKADVFPDRPQQRRVGGNVDVIGLAVHFETGHTQFLLMIRGSIGVDLLAGTISCFERVQNGLWDSGKRESIHGTVRAITRATQSCVGWFRAAVRSSENGRGVKAAGSSNSCITPRFEDVGDEPVHERL